MNKKQYVIVSDLPEYEITVKFPFFPAGTFPPEHMATGLDGIRMLTQKSAYAISLLWMSARTCDTPEQYHELHQKYEEFVNYLSSVIDYCHTFSERGLKEAWSKLSPEEKKEAKRAVKELLSQDITPEKRERMEKLLEGFTSE